MRYLYDVKLWDKIETVVEVLIFISLMIAGVIKLVHNDFLQALFYVILAWVISPWSGIDRVKKRYVLVTVYFLGLFVGYFH
ncbi:hypothetical protein [Anabaena azotica]|uniref:Uncharacterized protein n=1 Tax=Anabaena azotica FACHB-119 TaxID=947527 RepID=A0ABR8DCP4_9NOST|nr:hypothetical protein [Anabaena azotica]MBD2505000.1 hypothetical protein [Anabaena azotica FACHB-119]